MERSSNIEFGVGLFILFGLAALLFLSIQISSLDQRFMPGYDVTARFENIGGLKKRAPVTMSGVMIGRVSAIRFDPEQLNAVVTLRIKREYDTLPADSDATILSSGLLGGQYIALTSGGSSVFLQHQDEIELTQSAIQLENLIGKYLIDPPDSNSR